MQRRRGTARAWLTVALGAVILGVPGPQYFEWSPGLAAQQAPRRDAQGGASPAPQPAGNPIAPSRSTPPTRPLQPAGRTNGPASTAPAATAIVPPPDYVIGPDDQLAIVFWKEKDLSVEVLVRPDGMISLPLLNDVKAAGLTPSQLREQIATAADRFIADPTVTVVVKQINSRKVFITGFVGKAGAYPLTGETTVMQLIAMAGGLHEYANRKKIVIMRTEAGRQLAYRFNYDDVVAQKNVRQNILLKPGDTVIVP